MNQITQVLIGLFYTIEYGDFFKKLEASFLLALMFSPLAYIIELFTKYVMTDKQFIEAISLLISIDTAVGFCKHFKLNTVNWNHLLFKLGLKVVVCIGAMTVLNVFEVFSINKGVNIGYLALTTKMAILAYVGGGTADSLYILSGGKFPPKFIMNKVDKFNKTGVVKKEKV